MVHQPCFPAHTQPAGSFYMKKLGREGPRQGSSVIYSNKKISCYKGRTVKNAVECSPSPAGNTGGNWFNSSGISGFPGIFRSRSGKNPQYSWPGRVNPYKVEIFPDRKSKPSLGRGFPVRNSLNPPKLEAFPARKSWISDIPEFPAGDGDHSTGSRSYFQWRPSPSAPLHSFSMFYTQYMNQTWGMTMVGLGDFTVKKREKEWHETMRTFFLSRRHGLKFPFFLK